MAYGDSPYLLAELKALLARPTTDEALPDSQAYLWLANSQRYWVGQIAILFPNVMLEAPETMTTSDSGYTWTVAYEPVSALQVYDRSGGRLLVPGAEWDTNADYVPQGQTIRITGHRQRSVAPVARYVKLPGALDGSTAPVLKPTQLRDLLPPRAAYLFASSGGLYDPAPYLALETRLWSGDPERPGDTGLLGALRKMNTMQTTAAGRDWWVSPDFWR